MKILLTGANGFLGKIIYQTLINSGEVLTLGRSISDYNVDLSLEKIINFSQKFDIVIHAAGKAHVLSKEFDEESSFIKTNVVGTKNLLESLVVSGKPKYFVFISSVSVYGLQEGYLINEDSALSAKDNYGRSKILAEEIVENWCDENDVICTILRLPLLVGASAPGNLKSMIQGIKSGYYFNIDKGRAKKSMVLATDVAKFILVASETGGIYNLTDGCHPSFYELSKCIAIKLGKSYVPNISIFTAKFLTLIGDKIWGGFPLNSAKLLKITSTLTFDDSKARNAFNWKPTCVLEGFDFLQDD